MFIKLYDYEHFIVHCTTRFFKTELFSFARVVTYDTQPQKETLKSNCIFCYSLLKISCVCFFFVLITILLA